MQLIQMQKQMEEEMARPVPEGEQPRSAVEVVAEVLTKEVKSSTFLKNAGLVSGSNKPNKSNAAVSAHVQDLQEKLERSQQQGEEMREELAAIKRKAAEAEAAQAQRDQEFQELKKRAEEQDARFANMMALLNAKVQ